MSMDMSTDKPANMGRDLRWRFSVNEDGDETGVVDMHCLIAAAAWAISFIPWNETQEKTFLDAVGVRKKPLPQGGYRIVPIAEE